MHFGARAMGLFEKIHYWIFGHASSDVMRDFLKKLSWTFFGGVLAAVIMFGVNVIAGRLLGPEEFGRYNYVLSLASSLTFFFLLGSNQSSIRYIADKNFEGRQGGIMSASIFITFLQTLIIFIIFIGVRDIVAKKVDLSSDMVALVFFLGLVYSIRELGDSFMRAFGKFKSQSLVKILEALVVLVVFVVSYFLYQDRLTHINYVLSILAGAAVSGLIFFFLIRGRLTYFSHDDIKTVFQYNQFLIIGGITGLIIGLEKFFIGKFIGMESLGVYSAYYASSQMIVSNLGILFMNTFWPTVIANKSNLRPIIQKLSSIIFRFLPIWILLNLMFALLFVSLYGEQYPFHLTYLVLFSISSIANIIFFVFMNILNIDFIKNVVVINTVIYLLFLASIIYFRSITAYLLTQIVIYLTGIYYVREKLSITYNKIV